jgi:cytoskeletal protein RodZ
MADEEKTIVPTESVLDPARRADARKSRSRDGRLGVFLVLWILSFFAGLAGVIFWHGYSQFGVRLEERARPSITELKVQAPAAESVVASMTDAQSETPATTPPSTEGAGVAKGDLSVRVLNGGAAKGSAGVVTELLTKAGFTKAVAGNATGDYQGMTVYCTKGKDTESKALADALAASYKEVTAKPIPENVSELAQATCTVVIGAGAK